MSDFRIREIPECCIFMTIFCGHDSVQRKMCMGIDTLQMGEKSRKVRSCCAGQNQMAKIDRTL